LQEKYPILRIKYIDKSVFKIFLNKKANIMKKIAVIMLFFALISVGCVQKSSISKKDFNNPRDFRRPDFGQPDRKADVSGIVKSIAGNEVTIIRIERPQRNSDQANGENNLKTRNTERSAPAFGGQQGGRIPGAGNGMRNRGSLSEDEQKAMLERLKSMSTGEEAVRIPVGIQMLKPDTESVEKPEMIEASLSDITKDKMISVWLDESASSTKTASFVMITR